MPEINYTDGRDQASANVVPGKSSEPCPFLLRKAIPENLNEHPDTSQRRGDADREQPDHNIG